MSIFIKSTSFQPRSARSPLRVAPATFTPELPISRSADGAVSRTRYELEWSEPKTERSRRSVALDPTTVDVLRVHRKAQLAERLALGPAYQDEGLVFAREDGAPMHPDRVSKLFRMHADAVKLPRIRLHDMRHTHATLALRAGVHPKVVSERLGHSSIALTLDTYSHAIPAMQTDAAAKVAALVVTAR